jgi:porin
LVGDPVCQLRPQFDLGDIDGNELYYNAAVMKGFQVTSDLQVIEPADQRNDTAIVVGLRGTLGL